MVHTTLTLRADVNISDLEFGYKATGKVLHKHLIGEALGLLTQISIQWCELFRHPE